MSGIWKQAGTAMSIAAMMGLVSLTTFAQEPNPTTVAPGARSAEVITQGPNGAYIYNVKVVQRSLDAVNYLNRSGATHVGFTGTDLMPSAKGDAKVNAVTGKTEISARFEGLTSANGFGPEYLTYVLWAISADGRPQNLGELELAGNKASLDVTTSFQTFGMIVTAEPYFAVSTPSDVIVLKNVFTDNTTGVLQQVNVHYQLLPRGLYADTAGSKSESHPITDREHTPLALFEAYNAERIAQVVGAEQYTPDIMKEVATDIQNAQDIQSSKHRDVKMEFTAKRPSSASKKHSRRRSRRNSRPSSRRSKRSSHNYRRLKHRRRRTPQLQRRLRLRRPKPRPMQMQPMRARRQRRPTSGLPTAKPALRRCAKACSSSSTPSCRRPKRRAVWSST